MISAAIHGFLLALGLETATVSLPPKKQIALAGKLIGKLDQSGKFILMLNKLSALIMLGTAIFLIFSLF